MNEHGTADHMAKPLTVSLEGNEFFTDPYPMYRQLREHQGAMVDRKSGAYLFARYAEVEALLRDPRFTKSSQNAVRTAFDDSILFQDPPDHTRTRRFMNEVFSGLTADEIERRSREIAVRLCARMTKSGQADFMRDFAIPLPVELICELMGVPEGDRQELHTYSSRFIADDTVPEEENSRLQYESVVGMTAYFQRMIDRRLEEGPGSDMISAMLRRNTGKGELSHGEIVGNCFLLMIAGHETTVNLLGNGLYLFLREPARWNYLRRHPELLGSAIEEALRMESPVQLSTFRMNGQQSVFCGVTIAEGCPVTAIIGAANRDPEVFQQPDEFEVNRTANRHLAFGSGPHRCIGAQMARIEARVGFGVLLENAPGLRLEGDPRWLMSNNALLRQLMGWFGARRHDADSLRWRRNAATRGLRQLPVVC